MLSLDSFAFALKYNSICKYIYVSIFVTVVAKTRHGWTGIYVNMYRAGDIGTSVIFTKIILEMKFEIVECSKITGSYIMYM